jgi:hypothetical protein
MDQDTTSNSPKSSLAVLSTPDQDTGLHSQPGSPEQRDACCADCVSECEESVEDEASASSENSNQVQNEIIEAPRCNQGCCGGVSTSKPSIEDEIVPKSVPSNVDACCTTKKEDLEKKNDDKCCEQGSCKRDESEDDHGNGEYLFL